MFCDIFIQFLFAILDNFAFKKNFILQRMNRNKNTKKGSCNERGKQTIIPLNTHI